jgi:hypothetical protein
MSPSGLPTTTSQLCSAIALPIYSYTYLFTETNVSASINLPLAVSQESENSLDQGQVLSQYHRVASRPFLWGTLDARLFDSVSQSVHSEAGPRWVHVSELLDELEQAISVH